MVKILSVLVSAISNLQVFLLKNVSSSVPDAACPDKREYSHNVFLISQPRWLSWMCSPTGDQEVAGSTPAEVGNILSWRLIIKYFLRSFSPFH